MINRSLNAIRKAFTWLNGSACSFYTCNSIYMGTKNKWCTSSAIGWVESSWIRTTFGIWRTKASRTRDREWEQYRLIDVINVLFASRFIYFWSHWIAPISYKIISLARYISFGGVYKFHNLFCLRILSECRVCVSVTADWLFILFNPAWINATISFIILLNSTAKINTHTHTHVYSRAHNGRAYCG